MEIKELREHAKHIRANIVKMVATAKSGHPGGSLSAVELLSTIYFTQMDITAENVNSLERDRFVPVSYTHL